MPAFSLILLFLANTAVFAAPTSLSPTSAQVNDPKYGPIPGQSTVFNTYRGKEPTFPGNDSAPIFPTTSGLPGPDDLLFQNLLSAEWVIFSFYQQAVETFNASSFTDLGFPNHTYDRIQEIRDNENGHLRIFQDSISSNSYKPGPCEYTFGFGADPATFLATQTLIEVASMAFLTGLVQQAQLNASKGALTAASQTETRHEVWALIDIWNTSPFGGPIDTVYPYANQIMDLTNIFIIPGSCPTSNPVYPDPRQGLPRISTVNGTKSLAPGQEIEVTFNEQPNFEPGKAYHAVFFHGFLNITVPFDIATNKSTIPAVFDNLGLTMMVLADEAGAPTLDSVVAGPLIIVNQPAAISVELSEAS